MFAIKLAHGFKECVDGAPRDLGRRIVCGQDGIPFQEELFARGNEINLVFFQLSFFFNLHDGHLRVARQELIHETLKIRRKVLDDNETEAHIGKTKVGRHGIKKTLQGF